MQLDSYNPSQINYINHTSSLAQINIWAVL